MTAHSSTSLRRRLASFREAVGSRLWPVPLAAVIAAVIVGVALPMIDRTADASLPGWGEAILFSGGADAARAVLSAISGSLITAASLTFSLTVVALQLAANQGSPRLLRMFASDRMVHATLAMFLGTFAYAITVLRTVEDAAESTEAFVPRMSVTLASLLTLASVVMLTLFLAHLARQLRVETMMRDVHREASATITLMADDRSSDAAIAPERPQWARIVFAPASGFVTGVDRGRLVELAVHNDIVIRELRTVGSSVVAGTPLAEWWSPTPTTELDADELAVQIDAAFGSAYERTPTQDIGFGLRQLTDIAIKALSPGVNDPTTAVHALSHIAALLGDLAARPDPPAAYADDAGVARLVPVGDTFGSLVEVGIGQIRRYGAGDVDVVARMYGMLDDLAWRAHGASQRAVIAAQLKRLQASVDAEDYDKTEHRRFRELATRVRATLART